MLKNLSPLLSADLLSSLQAMGHGDTIAIVTRNFPAASKARRLISMPGVSATEVAEAVLSVLPVDVAVEPAVFQIAAGSDLTAVVPVQQEFKSIIDAVERREVRIKTLERFEFYARAEGAFVVVHTGETRLYGCFIITKGVIV